MQLEHITKVYQGNITALQDISCSLTKGIFGVVGPNAAGKTTFLKILAGLAEPTSGKISFNGIELAQHKQQLRSVLGYLPQACGFYSAVTGERMLDYIAVLKGVHDRAARRQMVNDVIDKVNLRTACKLNIKEYSYGMKRRLGIAQALLAQPRLLILDEPLEGLDPEESAKLLGIIAEIAECSLVVFTTHSLSNIEFMKSTLLVLCQGRLVYQGNPAELASLADGLVWQVEANFQQVEQLRAAAQIVGMNQHDGNLAIRVLAGKQPCDSAVPVPANLEEGYLVLMGAEVDK